MKIPSHTRQRPPALPGIQGTARVDRRTSHLIARLRPGDIAIVDHQDMDRATAQALVDAGVAAVLNASPMISGRYPNLGPDVLIQAGVPVLDTFGAEVISRIKDGTRLRVHEGQVFDGDESVAVGRLVDADVVGVELESARSGLHSQLESFTHNSTEFLRREQDLLLHGRGVPRTATDLAGRPVVVVVCGHDWEIELAGIKAFIREQAPVLIGVDAGADALRAAGYTPHIVVANISDDELPAVEVLKKAKDVVVLVERGAPSAVTERFARIGVRPLRFETGATTEDAALILADAGQARLIVGVGMHATLDEFLDRRRTGLASTYLTRLKVGPRLVDAGAVPHLYDGQVRPRHLLAVMVAGLLALAAAIGVTPVGQEWADTATPVVTDAVTTLIDRVQGLF
ncbi:putative cytokinetic ring protein SteA [Nocardioides allogilvus]|uniref:putative cytokinetic ring protein SteA n=1 Tax=Nocardioides allogilvus TaxID=2072017 RepID=UPI000D318BC7|nr:putative cytokinetic ring protein SteA [Nocardioides allogilvus]